MAQVHFHLLLVLVTLSAVVCNAANTCMNAGSTLSQYCCGGTASLKCSSHHSPIYHLSTNGARQDTTSNVQLVPYAQVPGQSAFSLNENNKGLIGNPDEVDLISNSNVYRVDLNVCNGNMRYNMLSLWIRPNGSHVFDHVANVCSTDLEKSSSTTLECFNQAAQQRGVPGPASLSLQNSSATSTGSDNGQVNHVWTLQLQFKTPIPAGQGNVTVALYDSLKCLLRSDISLSAPSAPAPTASPTIPRVSITNRQSIKIVLPITSSLNTDTYVLFQLSYASGSQRVEQYLSRFTLTAVPDATSVPSTTPQPMTNSFGTQPHATSGPDACASNPCSVNEVCISGIGGTKYICHCEAGYIRNEMDGLCTNGWKQQNFTVNIGGKYLRHTFYYSVAAAGYPSDIKKACPKGTFVRFSASQVDFYTGLLQSVSSFWIAFGAVPHVVFQKSGEQEQLSLGQPSSQHHIVCYEDPTICPLYPTLPTDLNGQWETQIKRNNDEPYKLNGTFDEKYMMLFSGGGLKVKCDAGYTFKGYADDSTVWCLYNESAKKFTYTPFRCIKDK